MSCNIVKGKIDDDDHTQSRPQKRAGMRRPPVKDEQNYDQMMKEARVARRTQSKAVLKMGVNNIIVMRSRENDTQLITLKGHIITASSNTLTRFLVAQHSSEKNGDIKVHFSEFLASSTAKNSKHHSLIEKLSEPEQWESFSKWADVAEKGKTPSGQTVAMLELSLKMAKFLGSSSKIFSVLNHAMALATSAAEDAEWKQTLQSSPILQPRPSIFYDKIRIIAGSADLNIAFQASCPLEHVDTTYGALWITLPVLAQLVDQKKDGTLPQSDGLVYNPNPDAPKSEGPVFQGRVISWQECIEHPWTKERLGYELAITTPKKSQLSAVSVLIHIANDEARYAPISLESTQHAIRIVTLLRASEDCMDLLVRNEDHLLEMEARLYTGDLGQESAVSQSYLGDTTPPLEKAPSPLNEESEESEEE